ncbi:unnamed protein product [Pseudo-nitzschia multistriata]|uniref:Uncharacterized protein n=1 Tax=Pseudo-nitzschia multistriata TaxID=183589 RepID=A0A448ZKJ2_9STRA|nr:unnamed protein product [Pseudo-nitzschia multistriata]
MGFKSTLAIAWIPQQMENDDESAKTIGDEMYSRASPHRVKSPRYLLISLGPSYERSEELYLLDFDSIIDDDRDSNCNDIEPKGLSHEKAERMEATLARKLISALMNQPGRGNEESVLQSLPKATSPSFRLYFTAGFKTPDSGVAPTNADDVPATTERHAQSGCTSNALVQENDPPLLGIHVNLTSLKSWIPRKRFPLLQRHYQSRSSSRVQSLVTIRFQRSPLRQQQENYTDEKKIGERLGTTPTTSPQMHPASNELTWMSSSASIKGFRL